MDNWRDSIYIEVDRVEELFMRQDVIDIEIWETPATTFPEIEMGSARIIRGNYKKGYYHNYGLKGYIYFRATKPIPVTELQIKENGEWKTWMVDDPPHWWSMEDYAKRSMGRILVAGLGLGLIVLKLMDNADVYSITIIERNKDVIDLILPILDKILETGGVEPIKIVNTDFFKFVEKCKGDEYDRIIVDIWATKSKQETKKVLENEVLPTVNILRNKFPDSSVAMHGFGIEW